MTLPEIVKPSGNASCGRPPECPCFQKFHEMRSSCLYDYYQAILGDDATTAGSTSRADTLESHKKTTKSTIQTKADRNNVEELVPFSDISKVTCPRCWRTYAASVSGKIDAVELCKHCRSKIQRPKMDQEKIKKPDRQKEGKQSITPREEMEDKRHILKRRSSSEIDLQRASIDKRLKTKLVFHSEDNLLEPKKNVDFKTSHEVVELYQSSSFRPVSNVTISDTKVSKNEVQSECSKIKAHHLSEDEKLRICSNRPLSEPTLLTLGKEERLTEYQKLMQSKVKRITGYDIEKGMIYYFPKISKLELKRHVSTSELIRDIREKHGAKFDEEAKRLEEEERKRLQILAKEREAEEKRRLARERWEKLKGKNKLTEKSKKPPSEPKEPKKKKEPKEPKEPKQPKEPKEPKVPLKEKKEMEPKVSLKEKKEMEPKKKFEPNVGDIFKKTHPPAPMPRPKDDDKDKKLAALMKTLIGVNENERIKAVPPQREPPLKPRKRQGKRSKIPHKLQAPRLEGSLESLNANKPEIEDIVIGQNICKYKPPVLPQDPNMPGTEGEVIPMLFKTQHSGEQLDVSLKAIKEVKEGSEERKAKDGREGIISYALSDRTFIEKGWTVLPVEKVVRKMNVYRMRPAHPEFDWFEHNKKKILMSYESGERLAGFDDNGRGRWYYKNGRLALDYYDAEEANAQQRFVVYSNGEPDEHGRSRPVTVLAIFDYLGNGVVFDHSGKIRLKYNQTDGIVLDRDIGPISHWKWHTLNDPPVLQQVMIDTQMPRKDPNIWNMGGPADFKSRPDNEEMLAIEFDNFIKEKSKKMSQSFKPFQIKMKALKINEHFSLKVLDQATIYLIFRDGSTSLKQNIGMILDPQEIVDTDTAELGVVSNTLERLPARTQSIATLQGTIAYAQHYEKTRTERERRLRPQVSCVSADRLTAARSRPKRHVLRTVATPQATSVASVGCCKCIRKPSNNLYYNSRLV